MNTSIKGKTEASMGTWEEHLRVLYSRDLQPEIHDRLRGEGSGALLQVTEPESGRPSPRLQ